MKKYNVGGSRTITVMFAIMMCLFLIMPVAMTINLYEEPLFLIAPYVIISLMEVFLLIIIIANEKGYRRMKKALAGKKATGIVKEAYYTSGRRSYYSVVISYKNANYEDREISFHSPAHLASKFTEGKRVPILVNGEYAYYDENELKKEVVSSNSYGYCPECGNALDGTEKFCKSCGHKL